MRSSRWAVAEADGDVAIRLAIGPSPRRIELPARDVAPGRGTVLREGADALLLAYGPVMLHEALTAAELLAERGTSVQVVDMPWLNRFDPTGSPSSSPPFEHVFVLEDHAPVGALGDALRRELDGRRVHVFGVEGWPACGTPAEALRAARPRRRLARRSAWPQRSPPRRLVSRRRAGGRLARPARPAADAGLPRVRHRRTAARAARRPADGRSRTATGRARALGEQAGELSALEHIADLMPARVGAGERVRYAASIGFVDDAAGFYPLAIRHEPAARLPRASGCARGTTTGSSTRTAQARCRVGPGSSGRCSAWHFSAASPRAARAPRRDAGGLRRARRRQPADAQRRAVPDRRPPARTPARRLHLELGPHRRQGHHLTVRRTATSSRTT